MKRYLLASAFAAWLIAAVAGGFACSSTIPEPTMRKYSFPKGEAFVEAAKRPYKALGTVKTKVEYESLDFQHDEDQLCRNYYNKAVKDLVKRARDVGADAVIKVRSVVFYEDGSHELFKTPECSDDGESGEILAVGIAVRWLPEPAASAAPDRAAREKPRPHVSPEPRLVPEPEVPVENVDDAVPDDATPSDDPKKEPARPAGPSSSSPFSPAAPLIPR